MDANLEGLADGSLITDLNSSKVTFTPSGSGGIARTVDEELAETISPFQFGGAGDGTTNDSAAVLAASVAAVAQGKDVDFGGHTWLIGTQLALTSSHAGLRWRLRGATIKKGFSGDLVTLTACSNFAIDGVGTVDGQHGTYTGKGFVLSGASDDPYFGPGIKFTSFTDSHIEFGPDSGKYAKHLSTHRAHSSQSDARMIHCTGPDTTAMQRQFDGPMNGYIDLDGTISTTIHSPLVTRVEISSACNVTKIAGTSWSNGGSAMTISGGATVIVGCRFAGNVTLDSNFTGSFVGNLQTSGTFTDSSAAGNLIYHIDTAGTVYIGKNTIQQSGATGNRIQMSRCVSAGDADVSFVQGTAPHVRYASTLTQARAVTLDDTAVHGDRALVSRIGAGDFPLVIQRENGFDLMTLLPMMWGMGEYDGTSWIPAACGTLTGGAKALRNVTAVGNVGAGEDDLITLTIPLGQIGTVAADAFVKSYGVKIRAWGTAANNSNPKTVKLMFGGSAILTTALTVSQAGVWDIDAEVLSTGTDTQKYVATLRQGGTTTLVDVENGTLAVNDGGAIIVKCTGTVTDGGGGINNDDIKQEGLTIFFLG